MKHLRLMAIAAAGVGLVGCSSASPLATGTTTSTTARTVSAPPTTASTTSTAPRTTASTTPQTTAPPPTTTGPATKALQKAEKAARASVQPLLLEASDLPKGWAVNRSRSAYPVSAFPNPASDSLVALSYAHVAFSMPGGLPGLTEELASVYSPAAGFSVTQIIYNNTPTFSITIDGQIANGSMHPVAAPTEGAQSAAYAATIVSGSQTVHQGIMIAQKGNYVVGVALTESGTVDMGELQSFVAEALAKLPTTPLDATAPTVPDADG